MPLNPFFSKHIIASIVIMILLFSQSYICNSLYASNNSPGNERLEKRIDGYESGRYLNAVINLEIASKELPKKDKESLWETYLYLGLSYLLLGDADESTKQFIKAQNIIKGRLPDAYKHSPKIVSLFKEALDSAGSGIEMVILKGGCYDMGDTFGDGEKDERPLHEVCVDGFYIGKYEVTQGQWERIMGSNPSWFKNGNNYPVENVSWNDVQKYIKKLNQKTGENYRLPTEAEWEYAARGGGKNEKGAGFSNENDLYRYANYCDTNCALDWRTEDQDDGYKYTSPAGSYNPNGIGIYDMTGNVWEWCSDWYDQDYYSNSPRESPKGASSGSFRVDRGGLLGQRTEVRASF